MSSITRDHKITQIQQVCVCEREGGEGGRMKRGERGREGEREGGRRKRGEGGREEGEGGGREGGRGEREREREREIYVDLHLQMQLLTRIRLARNFANSKQRLKCVMARLHAISILGENTINSCGV